VAKCAEAGKGIPALGNEHRSEVTIVHGDKGGGLIKATWYDDGIARDMALLLLRS
jgi:hypothetical protein